MSDATESLSVLRTKHAAVLQELCDTSALLTQVQAACERIEADRDKALAGLKRVREEARRYVDLQGLACCYCPEWLTSLIEELESRT